jgi:TPR repeat protein
LSAKYAVKEAVQWHIKKAETGEIDAMLVLASIYERGDIVPKDSEKALYWHELAAKFSTEDNIKNDYYLGKYLINIFKIFYFHG